MAYGWEGKLVRLVPVDIERHLDNSLKWLNDPQNTDAIPLGDFPMTRLLERDWVEAHSKPNDTQVSFAMELEDGEHIGFSGLHRINWRDGSAFTGTWIAREYWGKGYGSDAARTRTHYAFEVLGLRYLMSSVLGGNERSLAMVKKTGYVECGIFPKRVWKRGMFRDEILFYMTREMWLAERVGSVR